jgi:hypothetical protein
VLNEATSDILGYFALSFKELALEGASLSKNSVKRMDGINKNAERIRAFLIGQLGKNTAVKGNPVKLVNLLDEVYGVVSAARALIGGRVIILECDDSPRLIELYEKARFTLIGFDGEPRPSLRTMYIPITN